MVNIGRPSNWELRRAFEHSGSDLTIRSWFHLRCVSASNQPQNDARSQVRAAFADLADTFMGNGNCSPNGYSVFGVSDIDFYDDFLPFTDGLDRTLWSSAESKRAPTSFRRPHPILKQIRCSQAVPPSLSGRFKIISWPVFCINTTHWQPKISRYSITKVSAETRPFQSGFEASGCRTTYAEC
jgi:hypothetical protein